MKKNTVCTQFFGVESNGGHHHCNIVYGRQHEWSNKNARTTANRKKTTHEEMKLKLFLSTVSPVMSACALQPFHITLRKTSWRNGSLWIIYNISSCPSWSAPLIHSFAFVSNENHYFIDFKSKRWTCWRKETETRIEFSKSSKMFSLEKKARFPIKLICGRVWMSLNLQANT